MMFTTVDNMITSVLSTYLKHFVTIILGNFHSNSST